MAQPSARDHEQACSRIRIGYVGTSRIDRQYHAPIRALPDEIGVPVSRAPVSIAYPKSGRLLGGSERCGELGGNRSDETARIGRVTHLVPEREEPALLHETWVLPGWQGIAGFRRRNVKVRLPRCFETAGQRDFGNAGRAPEALRFVFVVVSGGLQPLVGVHRAPSSEIRSCVQRGRFGKHKPA